MRHAFDWLTFNSCQRFSIGFSSGLSGGVRHQLILLFWKIHLFVFKCLGSLSCMNRWGPEGYNEFFKSNNINWWRTPPESPDENPIENLEGNKVFSNMFTYTSAVMIPWKMHIFVLPFQLIPAQTWTFNGCLGRGLRKAASPNFRQHRLLWVSSWTVVSSVHSVNGSSKYPKAHSYLFSRLTVRISWQ